MARLAFSLLGVPALVVTGRRALALPTACWPILGYLLTQPGCVATRSSLAGSLWPDQSEESARHRLATVLWRFKSALRDLPSPVQADGDRAVLALGPSIWIDSLAFQRRVAHIVERPGVRLSVPECAVLRRAVRLYRGDLLATFEEEWIAPERERIRCLYLDGLYALARADAFARDWASVVTVTRRLCIAEPLREDAQRLLMRGYAETGNRALALKQYRQLSQRLAEELEIDPTEETIALARSLSGPVSFRRRSAEEPRKTAAPTTTTVADALNASRAAVGTALDILDRAIEATRRDRTVIDA